MQVGRTASNEVWDILAIPPNVSSEDGASNAAGPPNVSSSSVEAQLVATSSKGVGLVLEVFCGSSRLTKACIQLGLRGIAVDKDRKRSKSTTVLELDLLLHEDCKRLRDLVEAEGDRCFRAHFAPA